MGKIFQLRTKKKINNKIGEGFVFNVSSKCWTGHPMDSEIRAALEAIGGKDATVSCAWTDSKYEVLA